jgi:hypothetical protein
MNERERLHGWADRARVLLDESADGLDAATLSRLNRARQAALAQRRPARRQWALPAGLASACVLLLAVLTWHSYGPTVGVSLENPLARTAAPGDLDLVASEDSLEFYQDLEFYAWLETQDQDLGS